MEGGATTRRALLVLGSARSGTSALIHVLELLGVELGSGLKEAKAGANDKGYFEHVALHEANVALLAAAGGSWDDVAPRAARFFAAAALAPQREQLRTRIAAEFGARPLWGFKDPELCLLFPLWEELLAGLGIAAAPLLISRHPLEAASSFARLRASGPQHGLLVWLRTMVVAERATRGRPRALVTYEQLLADACGACERIGGALALAWPRAPRSVAAEIAAFLDPSLRRHRERSGGDASALESLALRFHAAFERAAAGDEARLPEEADAIAAELERGLAFAAPIADEARDRAVAHRKLAEELAAAAYALEKQRLLAARADGKVAKLVAEGNELRRTLARLRGKVGGGGSGA